LAARQTTVLSLQRRGRLNCLMPASASLGGARPPTSHGQDLLGDLVVLQRVKDQETVCQGGTSKGNRRHAWGRDAAQYATSQPRARPMPWLPIGPMTARAASASCAGVWVASRTTVPSGQGVDRARQASILSLHQARTRRRRPTTRQTIARYGRVDLHRPTPLRRHRRPTRLGEMTMLRMDNVGVVVDDLAAATAFFVELGLELEGEAPVEGGWVDRVVGLDGAAAPRASSWHWPSSSAEGCPRGRSPNASSGHGSSKLRGRPAARQRAWALQDLKA
jgi:hypothetical protein